MKKFKTQWDRKPSKGEPGGGISMTIPDQAMSVRDIMVRHQRGLPISARTPIYETEEDQYYDLPDLSRMELQERMEVIDMVKERLKMINEGIEQKKKAKQMDIEEQILAEKVEKKIAEMRKAEKAKPGLPEDQ